MATRGIPRGEYGCLLCARPLNPLVPDRTRCHSQAGGKLGLSLRTPRMNRKEWAQLGAARRVAEISAELAEITKAFPDGEHSVAVAVAGPMRRIKSGTR